MGYYEEIITEIRNAIEEHRYEDAKFLLKQELSMPYIPEDAEAQFQALQKDLRYACEDSQGPEEEPLEVLLSMLKGKPEAQLAAASRLHDRNLRTCTEEIREYLSHEPYPEAAALLIEALAEQEIGDEFVYTKDGVEYTFWPDAVTPVTRSPGFLEALALLKQWVSRNPSLLETAKSVLVHDAYMNLPLSYEKEEAGGAAYEAACQAADLLGDTADKAELEKVYDSYQIRKKTYA
ncbi:MAG: DUF3196 domain-containing protein [Stecheria intestinalis]|nr:DUF3196 domain-containing protein [Stecheria intestinalis]MDY4681246.1 hypothetical protein [Lachnospiraceae bacterium]